MSWTSLTYRRTQRLDALVRIVASPLVLGLLATACLLAGAYFVVRNVGEVPRDFVHIDRGVRDAWAGRPPYSKIPDDDTYNHPPGSALLLAPITWAPSDVASRGVGVLNLTGLTWLTAGTGWFVYDRPERRRAALWVLLVTAIGLMLGARMGRGNVDMLTCAFALGGFVVLTHDARRGRARIVAGVLLGVACALKPYGVALLPALVLADGVVVIAIALSIAVAANVVAMALFTGTSTFFTDVVPYLGRGQPVRRRVDPSLSGLVSRSNPANVPLRVAGALVLGTVCAALTWIRRRELHLLRTLVQAAALFAVTAFLVSASAFPYYWVYAAPALVALARWETRVVATGALCVLLVKSMSLATMSGGGTVRLVVDRADVVAFVVLFAAIAVDLAFGVRPAAPVREVIDLRAPAIVEPAAGGSHRHVSDRAEREVPSPISERHAGEPRP